MILDKAFGLYSVHCFFSDDCFQVLHEECYLGWPVLIHDRVEGAFIKVIETSGSLFFQNDICGLYRLYYWQDAYQIYITDNPDYFLSPEDYQKRAESPEEKELFLKSLGYTSGDATFYREIHKLPPASQLTVDQCGLRVLVAYPFRQIERTPDKKQHTEIVRQEVTDMLSSLKGCREEVILFYSGGADSFYLAKILLSLNVPFHPVFMYDVANRKKSNAAWIEAQRNASKISMPEIELCQLDSRDTSLDSAIAKCLRFDRHGARMHFLALEQITKKYGSRIVVVNGQNSDSIFSYGPSENSLSSLMKRYLMYGRNAVLKFAFALFCSVYCRKFLRFPRDLKEYYFTLATNFRYIKLYDLSYSRPTRRFFENKLADLIDGLVMNKNCAEMFLKIFYFVQGPDSQVVIQSAKYFKIFKSLLPFATSECIRGTLSYKDDAYELLHPKYCIRSVNEE